MNATDRILGLFAKWPAPGEVKTRLAVQTSPGFAAEVASAFLDDTLERWASYPARRILAFAPPAAIGPFTIRAGAHWQLLAQSDGDLGRRMFHFFGTLLAANPAARIVLIGADSPTLPQAIIDDAFAALDASDVVLGPATDGGYYLVGGTARMPLTMFDGVEYGQPDVLMETIKRLPTEIQFSLLTPWYDLDTLQDWQMLCGHVAALRRAGIDPRVPRIELLGAKQ